MPGDKEAKTGDLSVLGMINYSAVLKIPVNQTPLIPLNGVCMFKVILRVWAKIST